VYRGYWLSGILLAALFLGIALWTMWDNAAYADRLASYRSNCAAAGGHIYNPYSTDYCLTPDGRVIEVYP